MRTGGYSKLGFFQKLFNLQKNQNTSAVYKLTNASLLNGSNSDVNLFSGDLFTNSLISAIVNRIALYGSMITYEHVRGAGSTFEVLANSNIHKLLNYKPNDYMTPSDLQYKVWADLLIRNNSYQYIQRDETGRPISILPLIASTIEMKEIEGLLFYKFTFKNGAILYAYKDDVIHNRLYFYDNDIFGSTNTGLRYDLGLVDTMNVSLDASLKNSAQIKGILKHMNTIDPDDLKKQEELFRESYLSAKNSGGIGVMDAKFDFIPINYTGKLIDKDQMEEIRNSVYKHFGINDNILLSKYSSDEWQAYYEGMMSPVLNQMEQRYTLALLSDKSYGYGNRIKASVNQISFMNSQQKINMVKLALDGALYTRNEIREWFGDGPIEGGDILQYSKNFEEKKDGETNKTDITDTDTEKE